MYQYYARMERVVDGDTVEMMVDLGFEVYHMLKVRLARINCPEKNTPRGPVATAFTENFFTNNGQVIIITTPEKRVEGDKSDSFGRYIAEVWDTSLTKCLNDMLVEAGLAVYHTYSELPNGTDHQTT